MKQCALSRNYSFTAAKRLRLHADFHQLLPLRDLKKMHEATDIVSHYRAVSVQNLTFAQLTTKSLTFWWDGSLLCSKWPPPLTVASHAHPIHVLTSHFEIHFNIIFRSMPGCRVCYMPHPSNLDLLFHCNNFRWAIVARLITELNPSYCTLSLLVLSTLNRCDQ